MAIPAFRGDKEASMKHLFRIFLILLIMSLVVYAQPIQPECTGWPMYRGNAQCSASSSSYSPVVPAYRWEYIVGPSVKSPPLVSHSGQVYFQSGTNIYCLDAVGNLLWQKPVGIIEQPAAYPAAIGPEGTIHCYREMSMLDARNPDNGALLWSIPAMIFEGGLVTDDEGTVYFQDESGVRAVYHTSSNKWSTMHYTSGHLVLSPDNTLLYTFSTHDNTITAIDTETGTDTWEYTCANLHPQHLASMNDTLYVVSMDAVINIDPTGGQGPSNRWILNVPGAGSRPAVCNAMVYLMTDQSNLVAVSDKGTYADIRWETPIPWNGAIEGAPVVSRDGTIYVTSNGKLYVVNPGDGSIRAILSSDIGIPLVSQPSIGPDATIYAGSFNSMQMFKEQITLMTVTPDSDFTKYIYGPGTFTTTIGIAPGTVTTTIGLAFSQAITQTLPGLHETEYIFGGNAFNLDAFTLTETLPGYKFSQPLTITLPYGESGVAGLDESTLHVRFWAAEWWSDEGIHVHGVYSDTHHVQITTEHVSLFALFGEIPEAVCIYGIFGLVLVSICRKKV
jgi:outer membrane protein assembly factor BamB